MFEVTDKDIKAIEEVEEIYPSNGKYNLVDYILVKKEVGWYITNLVFDNGDVQPFMKSNNIPKFDIKKIKHFSGCKVYVEDSILKEMEEVNIFNIANEAKKYYQKDPNINFSRSEEGENFSF